MKTTRRQMILGGIASGIPFICKSKPIKSMISLKAISFSQENIQPIEIPYINDGLIAIWDGIMNGKNGQHDPNGGLVELISGTQTYVRRGSYVVNDDCIVGDGVVIASPPIQSITNLNGSGNLTIEACCSNDNSGRPIQFANNRPFSSVMFQPNGRYWMTHDSCTESVLQSKWASGFKPNQRGSRTLVVSSTTVQWFIDGIPDASSPRTKDFTVSSFPFSIFGWDWDYGFPAYGDFCAVRIYNRALTADEITHNYSIDKARFGL